MSSGFYSKIFRLHEEYFGKICESDLSYGSILKLIKAEYDKQFKLAGRTDYGSSIIDSYTKEINALEGSLEMKPVFEFPATPSFDTIVALLF